MTNSSELWRLLKQQLQELTKGHEKLLQLAHGSSSLLLEPRDGSTRPESIQFRWERIPANAITTVSNPSLVGLLNGETYQAIAKVLPYSYQGLSTKKKE